MIFGDAQCSKSLINLFVLEASRVHKNRIQRMMTNKRFICGVEATKFWVPNITKKRSLRIPTDDLRIQLYRVTFTLILSLLRFCLIYLAMITLFHSTVLFIIASFAIAFHRVSP